MRRISDLISYAPAALLAIALASTVSQWRPLIETGGWFALLGHFLMVAATLVLLYLAVVLVLCLAALPLIVLFCRNEDNFLALAEAGRAGQSRGALLAYLRRIIVARLNSLLRAVWRCWWFLRGGALAGTGRGEG